MWARIGREAHHPRGGATDFPHLLFGMVGRLCSVHRGEAGVVGVDAKDGPRSESEATMDRPRLEWEDDSSLFSRCKEPTRGEIPAAPDGGMEAWWQPFRDWRGPGDVDPRDGREPFASPLNTPYPDQSPW